MPLPGMDGIFLGVGMSGLILGLHQMVEKGGFLGLSWASLFSGPRTSGLRALGPRDREPPGSQAVGLFRNRPWISWASSFQAAGRGFSASKLCAGPSQFLSFHTSLLFCSVSRGVGGASAKLVVFRGAVGLIFLKAE